MRAIDAHLHWYARSFMSAPEMFPDIRDASASATGYRYYYNGGKLSMDLPHVWFDLPQGLADSAAAVPAVTVTCTTGVVSGLLDQLPSAAAAPIAREYIEQLAEAQAKCPGRFYGTANIPLNDTNQATAMVDEAVKEIGLVGANPGG